MSEKPPIRPEQAPSPPLSQSAGASSSSPAFSRIHLVGVSCFALLLITGVVGCFGPAVNGAREAGDKSSSMNNLRQVALAFMLSASLDGHYPARAIVDEEGKPLLSWRVAILPDIGEKSLYEEFHLDEPWDSPHNRPLAERIPEILRSPGTEEQSLAHYQLPVGPGTPFEGYEALEEADIKDGFSTTILIVEADKGVPWTKPVDWEYDPSNPTQGLGNLRKDGFCTVFADGRVVFQETDSDLDSLRTQFTHNAGD